VWTDLDLFEFDPLGLLARFGLLLLLLEPVFSVVEDFADWRNGIGGHLDKIEASFACGFKRRRDRHFPLLLPFCIDEEHAWNTADLLVDARPVLSWGRRGVWTSGYRAFSCSC